LLLIMNVPDIEHLRFELFLVMARARAGELDQLPSEDAARLGEHAARLAKEAMNGMASFDRTGDVHQPRRLPPYGS